MQGSRLRPLTGPFLYSYNTRLISTYSLGLLIELLWSNVPMCNLYSITTNQAAIAALFRVVNRYVGNLAPMPVAQAKK